MSTRDSDPPPPSGVGSLLSRRLLFVTGKGGVGKSTVAAALGMLGARHGRRTLVAEVAGRGDVPRALGGSGPRSAAQEIEIAPGLHWTTIEPQQAMEEYLTDQLPVRALAELLASSRIFGYLAAATPGMRELLTVGKLWELAQPERRRGDAEPYDLVVVDAPATGHGLAYLAAPRTFARVARVGPIARQGLTIHEMLADPKRTGVVAVTTAAEMPVTEALWLHRQLPEQMGLCLDRVVVNRLIPERFSTAEADRLAHSLRRSGSAQARPHGDGDHDRKRQIALRAGLSQHQRAREERRQLGRLTRATGRSPATLGLLYRAQLQAPDVARLADRLERVL